MIRRATLLAAVFAVGALLVPAGSSAATEPLTEKNARPLAVKLAKRFAAGRDAVSFDVSDRAAKVRSSRVVFLYEERTPDVRHCNAKIAVTQSGSFRRAVLYGTLCKPVPDEVLAVERATRAGIRAIRPKAADVVRAVDAALEDNEACEDLKPPKAVRQDVVHLLEADVEIAGYEPVLAELDAHAKALDDIGVKDDRVAAGVISWRRWLDLFASIPAAAKDACSAVRRWADDGYAADRAPIDFDAFDRLTDSFERQDRRFMRASARLDALGANDQAVEGFVPAGLLALGVR